MAHCVKHTGTNISQENKENVCRKNDEFWVILYFGSMHSNLKILLSSLIFMSFNDYFLYAWLLYIPWAKIKCKI